MKKYDWSIERLEPAVSKANCWFQCLELLGIPKQGCNYRTLKNKVELYDLDTSHFNYNHAHLYNGKHYQRQLRNRPSEELFAYGSKVKTENLKKEYIRRFLNGIAHCENCGISSWNGQELVFQIHHVDGDHQNHSKSNLILLCPNCHSQTETFSNKKRSLRK